MHGSPAFACSTTAICSTPRSQSALSVLSLPTTIQLQLQEMCSGSVISVYCMQNQQAWNIEQSNYGPNEADLRRSLQRNTL